MEIATVWDEAVPSLLCKALFILAIALCAPMAHAGSTCPATPEQVTSTAQQASDAFAAMNGTGFDQARSTLTEQLGCLNGPPDPAQAAAIHLVGALAAFMEKDVNGSLAAFQAMYESDPDFALSQAIAPAGGPLSRRGAEARAMPRSARAPHGLSLQVFVDGREASDLPTSRPALVVVVGADGRPRWSGLVAAGETIPAFYQTDLAVTTSSAGPRGNGSVAASTPPAVVAERSKSKAARPVLFAAGGSAVVAGVFGLLYIPASDRVSTAGELIARNASASDWEAEFQSQLTTEEVYALRDRARFYEVGAQTAAGLALGLGAVGLVIAW